MKVKHLDSLHSRSNPSMCAFKERRTMRNAKLFTCLVPVSLVFASSLSGQNTKDAIQQKLVSEYALTQPTADNTDIVTAGSVLVLKKGNIMMTPVTSANLYQNTYKNGQLTQNALGKMDHWLHSYPGAS